jgi:hypothetical protein
VASVKEADLFAAPGPGRGGGREHVRGVTRDALVVLDGAALLRDPRLFIDERDDA